MNLQHVRESIKMNEGLRLKPYKCTAGKLTIGYGRNLEDNGINEYEADILLKNDIWLINRALIRKIENFEKHPQNVREVLIEMAYQMGINGLMSFKKMLGYMKSYDYPLAYAEMLNSKWATQTPERAKKLSDKLVSHIPI